jgi:mono/diheme cytochrome c family protein
MPGWLMAIWWGSLIFSAAYLIFYALSFGEGTMEAEYRGATQQAVSAVDAYFEANPLVPPSPADLLAGAANPAVLEVGRSRFTRTCASCHGEQAQGLSAPISPTTAGSTAAPSSRSSSRWRRAGPRRACLPGAAP